MICQECEQEFVGSRTSQLFCCEECRRRYWHREQKHERRMTANARQQEMIGMFERERELRPLLRRA
jgi:hypothetical protein